MHLEVVGLVIRRKIKTQASLTQESKVQWTNEVVIRRSFPVFLFASARARQCVVCWVPVWPVPVIEAQDKDFKCWYFK